MPQSALRALDQAYMMGMGQGPAPVRVPKTRGQTTADVLGAASIPMSAVPIAGDITGILADAAMYAAYPEERTYGNYAMSALGVLPFVPGVAAVRAARGASPLEGTLDMSQAARMQRAAEQGFDERVFYHGGSSKFDEFAAGKRGIYFTDDPRIADIYAANAEKRWPGTNNASPNVIPARLKGPSLVVSDQQNGDGGWYQDNLAKILGVDLYALPTVKRPQALHDEAKKQGYGFIEIRDMSDLGGTQTQFVPLDTSNIRSVNAAFDPTKRGSANLLAGAAGATIGLSALRNIQRDEEAQPD